MKRPLKVLLAHPGTQYSYHLAAQLDRLGLLYKYQTGFTIPADGAMHRLYALLPGKYKEKLSTRLIDIPADKVIQNPRLELQALKSLKKGNDGESVFYKRNKAFQEGISDKVLKAAEVVIGFDTSSWILAGRCKKLNKRFILDVSIGHPLSKEAVYKNLADLYPEWQQQIRPKSDFLISIENTEIELADTLVVPSSFVKQTYIENGVNSDKIVVNPFGTSVSLFNTVPHQNEHTCFLFFGGLTARKGLPFLLSVWKDFVKKYPDNSLILAGYGELPKTYTLPVGVKNIGVVAPANRQQVFNMADVFVFPSFFEGLAQVQLEAAACGLAVIGSTQSGAADLVEEGKSGFVVTPGDSQALFNAMEHFIKYPAEIKTMGDCSRQIALGNFTWEAYGRRWAEIVG